MVAAKNDNTALCTRKACQLGRHRLECTLQQTTIVVVGPCPEAVRLHRPHHCVAMGYPMAHTVVVAARRHRLRVIGIGRQSVGIAAETVARRQIFQR